jgi:hypothetical protein
LIVPEPKHSEPERFKVSIPPGIEQYLLHVLAAVDLDDEMLLEADEVYDIRADWSLAAELVTEDLT